MAKKSKFSRGYDGIAEEQERIESERESRQNRLFDFFITEDEEKEDVPFVFLTDEPITPYVHKIQTTRNGKRAFDVFVCTEDDDCPYCGENRAQMQAYFLVIDQREYEYKDAKGKKKIGNQQIKLFPCSTRVATQVERLHDKYGILFREMTIIRLDNNGNYTLERGEELDLTSEEILNIMPDWLAEQWDETDEGLYTLIENQLDRMIPEKEEKKDKKSKLGSKKSKTSAKKSSRDDDEDEDEDDEDEAPPKRSKKSATKTKGSRIVEVDDDDEDEDEEDDEPPRRSSMKKSSSSKSSVTAPKSKSKGLSSRLKGRR